jgi:hypothetical protein
VLGNDSRCTPARLPAGTAEALDVRAESSERLQRALEIGTLVVLGLRERRVMRIRVVAHFVALGEQCFDRLRVTSAVQPGTKKVARSEYSRSSSRMRGTPTSGPYAWCDITPAFRA